MNIIRKFLKRRLERLGLWYMYVYVLRTCKGEGLNERNGRGLMWEGEGLNRRKGRGLYGKLGEQCKLLERRLESLD